MRSSFFVAAVASAIVPQAFATLYITEPVVSTTCSAQVVCNIRWNDDGNQPALAAIGPASVGLYVGSQQQQTLVQSISDSVDVSTTANIQWTPNPSLGSDGSFYFIRFSSLGLKDTANPQYPYQGFSAKFTLNGMTGTFNSTISSQIAGASVPATGSPTGASPSSTGSTTPSGTPGTSKVNTVTTGSSKPTGSSSGAAPTTTTNGASKLVDGGVSMSIAAIIVAALASVF